MWSFILHLLKPPKFDDDNKTRAAEVLHVILLTLFVVLGVLAFFTDYMITFLVTAGMAAASFFLWLIMRRGWVNLASWCLMVFLVAGTTLIVYYNGSIRVPAASGFVGCIVVAALTLGNRATIGSAIVISGILLVLYLAEITGKLPPVYYQETGFLQWITYVGIICITAVLPLLARNNMLTALELARYNESALAERNQKLQAEIARLRQMEISLRESEERYRTLFELESDAIMLIDADSMEILDANAAAVQLYGYDRGELLSMSATELLAEPDQARQFITIEHQISHIPLSYDRDKEGKVFPVEITGRYFDWQGKKLFLLAARNITERVRAEDVLHEQHEQLEELVEERTARLTSINQELESFSYSVAHDLRAPLRAINGFSLALLEDHADRINAEMRSSLDHIISASRRMNQLIDALLSLSRLTQSEIIQEEVDLSAMARMILDELHQRDPQRDVETVIADGLIVEADRRLMQVVLGNLLGNAWKFTAGLPRAYIELGVEKDEIPVYFVRDNGAGFNMDYAHKLFGAFQRLHSEEEFPGTGIGLATVQRIIHRHNGEVWATGKVSQGATFYFTLP